MRLVNVHFTKVCSTALSCKWMTERLLGLYMMAFGVLRSVFTAHELGSLADLMAERGLRLRQGLDEVLEGWDMGGVEESGDNSDSEGGESEIERRAEELRRLMPY